MSDLEPSEVRARQSRQYRARLQSSPAPRSPTADWGAGELWARDCFTARNARNRSESLSRLGKRAKSLNIVDETWQNHRPFSLKQKGRPPSMDPVHGPGPFRRPLFLPTPHIKWNNSLRAGVRWVGKEERRRPFLRPATQAIFTKEGRIVAWRH